MLAQEISKHNRLVRSLSSFEAVTNHLNDTVQKGDVIMLLGAGDINNLASTLITE